MAVPASAAKPFVWLDETFVVEDEPFVDEFGDPICGFPVYVTETVKVRGTDHFDKDGNFVFGVFHARGTSYYYSDYVTLPKAEHWSWVSTLDAETMTNPMRGNSWGLIGILEERGRIVFDFLTGEVLFEAGKWPVFHDGFGPLCDALAPPT
jgi:hypothetical protein